MREQAEYWDDLLEQLEVNYGLVDRMIRRLKGFYDDVSFSMKGFVCSGWLIRIGMSLEMLMGNTFSGGFWLRLLW